MIKYHILGAGIAGLLAAKAVEDSGAEAVLYDKNQGVSTVLGLHYLHKDCGIEDLEKVILYNLVLHDENDEAPPYVQYSNKTAVPIDNSVKDLPLKVEAFNMQDAYMRLTERFQHQIVKRDVDRAFVDDLLLDGNKVISSIPLPILVKNGDYKSKIVFAHEGKPHALGLASIRHNIVVYNTDRKYPWYRYSRVNGYEWTETLLNGQFKIKKVMGCNVKSFNKNLLLVGRYGKWQRGVLAHEAYYDTKEAISNGF